MDISQEADQKTQVSPIQETKSVFWKAFGVLLFLAVLGTALNLPTNFFGYKLTFAQPIQMVGYILTQLALAAVLGSVVIWLGLVLGKPLGIGAPLLRQWIAGDSAVPRRFRATLPLTLGMVVLSFFCQLVIGTIGAGIAYARIEVSFPLWVGILGGIGAGLTEEILYRLGLLTFLLWLAMKIFRQTKLRPALFWPINSIAALLFGTAHLIAAHALGLSAITEVLATAVPGMIFGWLYWRLGLFQSMLAHICHDAIGYTLVYVVLFFVK